MDATKDLIVAASPLPVSVIIIGVGDEDFEAMIELDGDEVILTNNKGTQVARDIVQFVKYNDFKNAGYHALSEEVLRELPDQVVSYLMHNKIEINRA
jgi:predicted lipoprotein